MVKATLFIFALLFVANVSAQEDVKDKRWIPISKSSNIYGAWEADGGEETNIQPIDEEAPGGYILVLREDVNYFSSWVDEEMGASIDLQFDYELVGNQLNCTVIGSNALGWYMQNENRTFSFQLYISEDEENLVLQLQDETKYILTRVNQ